MTTRMQKYQSLRDDIEKYNRERKEHKRRFKLITEEAELAYYNLFHTTIEEDINEREEYERHRRDEQRRRKRLRHTT